jgi:hypothetical protein
LFNFDEFESIQDENCKDFIRRLLTENYKKPWNADEFNEDNEENYVYDRDKVSSDYSDIRMSTMQAITHPWIQDVSTKLVDDIQSDKESMKIATLSL